MFHVMWRFNCTHTVFSVIIAGRPSGGLIRPEGPEAAGGTAPTRKPSEDFTFRMIRYTPMQYHCIYSVLQGSVSL